MSGIIHKFGFSFGMALGVQSVSAPLNMEMVFVIMMVMVIWNTPFE